MVFKVKRSRISRNSLLDSSRHGSKTRVTTRPPLHRISHPCYPCNSWLDFIAFPLRLCGELCILAVFDGEVDYVADGVAGFVAGGFEGPVVDGVAGAFVDGDRAGACEEFDL